MKKDKTKNKNVSQEISDGGVVERINKADIMIVGICHLVSLFLLLIGIMALIQ